MKKKHFTKAEVSRKEALEYLSRRDFLGGSVKAGSFLALPWAVKEVFRETSAFAAIGGPAAYPVVQINLRGGWGGAVVPLSASGTPLSGNALGRYGVDPSILSQPGLAPQLFGVQYFDRSNNINTGTEEAEFIRGLVNKITGNTDPAAFSASLSNPGLARIQCFTVANDGQDDNGTNPMGCNSVLTAGGFKGVLVDSIGLRNSATGMSNVSVLAGNSSAPFIAPNKDSIQDLLAYTPALKGRSQGILDNFANALKNVGALQGPRLFASVTKKDDLVSSVNSAHADNLRFTSPNSMVLDANADARYSNIFQGLFNAGQALTANAQLYTFATAFRAMMLGQINFLGYDMPDGYDYHGQIAADNGNTKGTRSRDRIAGQMLGSLMNLALAEGKNLIIVLTSDGACQGVPNHLDPTIWTGDRGQQNLMHFYVVSGNQSSPMPTRAPGKFQIGGMRTDTGTVDTSQFSGKGDMAAASLIAVNMLYLNGVSPDNIVKIFPSYVSTANLMSYIVFPS